MVDQIRLWELEKNRLQATEGFLMKDFDSVSDFEDVARYAEDVGVLVWYNKKKMIMFINAHGIHSVSEYMKRRRKQ